MPEFYMILARKIFFPFLKGGGRFLRLCCGVQTLPLKMHYGGDKLGGYKKEWPDFDPQRTQSYYSGSKLRCKVSSKLIEIGGRKER